MSNDSLDATKLDLPLPWHRPLVAKLEQALRSGRMPHALLIHGIEGLGKRALAGWLAKALLCEAQTEESVLRACGECASCNLVAAGSHPDLVSVAPEEDKQQISVDQIRAANERLAMTSARKGYRIAIVDPAHQLTISAANSLLKTLEEPGAQSLLILLTSKVSEVLATLRSRCQRLNMHRPSATEAAQWFRMQYRRELGEEVLNFVGGAPLKALSYANGEFERLQHDMLSALKDLLAGRTDLTKVAHAWNDEGLSARLIWLDSWICQLLKQKIAGNADPVTRLLPATGAAGLPSVPELLNINGLYALLDRVRELKAQLTRTALQKELALEGLLIGLSQVWDSRPAINE